MFITIEPGALPEDITPDMLETMPLIPDMVLFVHRHGAKLDGLHVRKRRDDDDVAVITPETLRARGMM